MDLSLIVMIVGIVLIAISFFIKDSSKKVEKDLEELSISIYQETNGLKRRLKILEEELFVEPSFQVKSPGGSVKKNAMDSFQQVAAQVKAAQESLNQGNVSPPPMSQPELSLKPVHGILVSQVIELNKQGMSLDEICKLSTLSPEQVRSILASNGGL
ncbi:hypothetical protein [Lysinibacillus sp. 54212]|uniref:hypothetical protein n=1 Tax=Lysinibacillus sp. 54212 TaxID=3119829 RepID=UPI002FCB780A